MPKKATIEDTAIICPMSTTTIAPNTSGKNCRAYGDLGTTYEFIETVFDRDFGDMDDDTPEAHNEINKPACE